MAPMSTEEHDGIASINEWDWVRTAAAIVVVRLNQLDPDLVLVRLFRVVPIRVRLLVQLITIIFQPTVP